MPAFERTRPERPCRTPASSSRPRWSSAGWSIPGGDRAALPDGGYLVTERAGRLRHVAEDGTVSDPISGVPEVLNQEQGGLLDVALSPSFTSDRMVYLTYSKPMDEGMSATAAAARGTLNEDMTALEGV